MKLLQIKIYSKKRKDQYDYKEFCKLALNEKLMNINKLEYHNKPNISIITKSEI